MTTYERDQEWEGDMQWARVGVWALFPVLIGMMVLDKWIHG